MRVPKGEHRGRAHYPGSIFSPLSLNHALDALIVRRLAYVGDGWACGVAQLKEGEHLYVICDARSHGDYPAYLACVDSRDEYNKFWGLFVLNLNSSFELVALPEYYHQEALRRSGR